MQVLVSRKHKELNKKQNQSPNHQNPSSENPQDISNSQLNLTNIQNQQTKVNIPSSQPNDVNSQIQQVSNQLSSSLEYYAFIPQLATSDSQRRITVTSKLNREYQVESPVKKSQTSKKIHHLGRSNIKREVEKEEEDKVEKRLSLTEKKKKVNEGVAETEEKTVLSIMRTPQVTRGGIALLYQNQQSPNN